MSDENLAQIRDEKAKKVQHPKGKLTAYERINLVLDEGSFNEIDENVSSEANPDGEAVITGSGTIHGDLSTYTQKISPLWEEVWERLSPKKF